MIIQLIVQGIESLPMTFAGDILHACKRANMPLVQKKDNALFMNFNDTSGTLTFRATKLDISSAPPLNFDRVSFLVARELKAKGWNAAGTYTVTEYTP